MSARLVKHWRRIARQWSECAHSEMEKPRGDGGLTAEREFAYARIFNECADSLERSLATQARKARAKKEGR